MLCTLQIEARSCGRFYASVPYLEDKELKKFYSSLVKSEARHFQNYLKLADNCEIDYQPSLKKISCKRKFSY